jgi:Amt family ammonium transporter
MVGMVMTGVFAKDVGLINGTGRTFAVHLLALVVVTAFAFIGSWILYRLADAVLPMRVASEAEADGLDLSQHGVVAATFDADNEGVPMLEHVA